MAKLPKAGLAAQLQDLPEQAHNAGRWRLRNSPIVRKSGRCIPVTAAKSQSLLATPRDLARRVNPLAVRIKQQRPIMRAESRAPRPRHP